MRIVVIIPMHNLGELTTKCINLVRKHAGVDCDILVVDDGSTEPYSYDYDYDGDWEGEDYSAGGVDTLRLDDNYGFTYAVNEGIRALKLDYDYVCLLNNDTEPEPGFLKALVDTAESDKGIGIVGSARIASREPYKVFGAGMDLTTGLVAGYTEDMQAAEECAWIPFCSVLISRRLVETIGLLEERLINHCSDNDYCLRALMADFVVIFEPRSKVYHHQSCTINADQIQPYEDQKTFAKKWFGSALNEILGCIPVNYELNKWGRLVFDYYEARPKQELPVL